MPEHAQANSQLAGLAARMERLTSTHDTRSSHATADEILVEMLMVLGKNMPSEPRTQIGRALTAFDQINKKYT